MKKHLLLFITLFIGQQVVAQVAGKTSVVNIKAVCLKAVAHNDKMDELYGYGSFTGFETQVMKFYAKIPYKELPPDSVKILFENFWNENLLGVDFSQLCNRSYAPMSIYGTGSVLRWLVIDGDLDLFKRLTNPLVYDLHLETKSVDGNNLQEWLEEHIAWTKTEGLKETYREFLEVLIENQARRK